MNLNRRDFIKGGAIFTAATVLSPQIAFGSKTNSAIRIGIIGCGNRGSAVLGEMAKSNATQIIAVADLYEDKIHSALMRYNPINDKNGFPKIPASNLYIGPDAYKELLNNKDIDAVIISSPAYTHPLFIETAIEAGKHFYCEKPAAIDVNGCKRIEKAGQSADGRLSMMIGFQIRYASPYVEMVKRIKSGMIGEIISANFFYFSSLNKYQTRAGISMDEERIRNHFYYRSLSGGILLDQGIHMLDVCRWTLDKNPLSAQGTGNRKGLNGPGDSWSNFQIIYEFPDDIYANIHSTKISPKWGGVSARFLGTEGFAEARYSGGVFIEGIESWDSGVLRCADQELTPEQAAAGTFKSSLEDSTINKTSAFINSIRTGKYLNELQSGVDSTMTAILGREAAKKGKTMNWDTLKDSNLCISPGLDKNLFNDPD